MRTLTDHIVAGDSANHQLQIEVVDEAGQGGAHHEYRIMLPPPVNPTENTEVYNCFDISFQNGPIREVGVNGLTHEALLAILIDRMRSFQAGPFACDANSRAMIHMQDALGALQERTKARIARGVEGTHDK